MRDWNRIERQYAEFYDLFVEDFERDLPVYLDLIAKHPGPVLEGGCRTGRVTRRLAEAGCEVRGIDISREQVDLARERLKPHRGRVRLSLHDLRREPLLDGFSVGLVTLYTINGLIDVEEQRLYMRHLRQSVRSPGVVALDCFCPLSMIEPSLAGEWRTIERESRGRNLVARDLREMLTPLLERRRLRFSIDGGPEEELVTHRRYLPPAQVEGLLEESGFEGVCWMQGYDSSTLQPIDSTVRPTGPFIVLAEA
jgi:SAM-dependent methyltransferase